MDKLKFYPKYVDSIVRGCKKVTIRKTEKVSQFQVGQVVELITTTGLVFGKAVVTKIEVSLPAQSVGAYWKIEGYQHRSTFIDDIDLMYPNESVLGVLHFKYLG